VPRPTRTRSGEHGAFTSGTTGEPKAALHTLNTLGYIGGRFASALGLGPDRPFIPTLSPTSRACWAASSCRCKPTRTRRCAHLTFTRPRYLAAGVINPELRPVSAPRAAQLLEEGVVVDLDPLIQDAAFVVVAEDVGQLEHDVSPIGWERSDR
jgi:hypothetical protein